MSATFLNSHPKILYLITSLDYAGAEKQLAKMACELKSRGWQLCIVSILAPEMVSKELIDAGIPILYLGSASLWSAMRSIIRLRAILLDFQPHILHSFLFHANVLARVLRLFVSIPVVISSFRSVRLDNVHRRILCRLTDGLCDITTTNCEAALPVYLKERLLSRDKHVFIPNAIDIHEFYPDSKCRREYRTHLKISNAFVWLTAGRMEAVKNYPMLFRAFARLVHSRICENMILIVCGKGPLLPMLRAFVKQLKIENKVLFLGARSDMPQIMNAADAFVLASEREGMPNVLLEASASGLPIVATDVGGNRDIVKDHESGYLVPSKKTEELAGAMEKIMQHPEDQRTKMGEAGRLHVREQYELGHVVLLWTQLYQELMAHRISALRTDR